MKNKQKHPDPDLLHSPREAEVAPGQPCTDDRASRVAASFPIKQFEEGTSLEPLETLNLSDGVINWRASDHRNQPLPKRTKLRNRD